MYFAENFIERIRMQTDIVSIISEYTNLIKRGTYAYVGKCPFHNEKTPSFSISQDKQMYYCFGCGVGGNVITFVMEKENLSFGEAIEYLATKANIPLEYDNSNKNHNREAFLKKDTMLEFYRKAARFYYDNLVHNIPEYVKQYLAHRKINEHAIKKFGLGFAPDSFNALYNYLKSEGATDQMLVESGLCAISSKTKQIYDKFRNRLIFPIISPTNKVIAFGGRVFGDENPKYLNSPENLIFHKGNNLYGLNLAKKQNYDYYILVEGYMDVIALHMANFSNTIASLGTAFTLDQAKLLHRYTDDVVIIYDSDAAGQKASLKASKILRSEGFNVKILELLDAKDPDEFIQKYGPKQLRQAIESSHSDVWHEIIKTQSLYDLNNVYEKLKFLEKVSFILANLTNSIEQELYISEVSLKFSIEKSAIINEMKKKIVQNTKDNEIVYKNHSQKNDVEVDLLSVLYHNPAIYDDISGFVFSELFTEGVKRNIACHLFNKETIDTDLLIKQYPNVDDQKIISSIIVGEDLRYRETSILSKMIKGAINNLTESHCKKIMRDSTNPQELQYATNLKNNLNRLIELNIVPKNG
ncbi:DNA primase [Candidatus Epulonipiscioides saccharophilum]|nr:DNA primase [Epulopiscium sp. SCG-B10WGA-EpuloB]